MPGTTMYGLSDNNSEKVLVIILGVDFGKPNLFFNMSKVSATRKRRMGRRHKNASYFVEFSVGN